MPAAWRLEAGRVSRRTLRAVDENKPQRVDLAMGLQRGEVLKPSWQQDDVKGVRIFCQSGQLGGVAASVFDRRARVFPGSLHCPSDGEGQNEGRGLNPGSRHAFRFPGRQRSNQHGKHCRDCCGRDHSSRKFHCDEHVNHQGKRQQPQHHGDAFSRSCAEQQSNQCTGEKAHHENLIASQAKDRCRPNHQELSFARERRIDEGLRQDLQ